MRSIFAKIVVWSLGTFGLSLVAYWGISRGLVRDGPPAGDPFGAMIALIEEDACRAYEAGGSDRLAEHLKRLDAKLPGQHLLTDARGLDLVSGADRSDLVKLGRPGHEPPRLADGRMVFIGRPHQGRYRFITIVRPWFGPPNILPYYGAIVLVIAGMGWILAVHLASPLRRLRRVVDRFGQGELSARVGSARKDEIGELSRAFDEMAGRIETLLSAERRLLQDVSHELRSPLARLQVAVELAASGADQGRAIERIKRDLGRLSLLVDELLQLTRAEGDPAARAAENIPLADLLRGLVEDCSVEAEARNCQLALHIKEACSMDGDWELLRRAIENVVRNAIGHAPPGTLVEIGLESRSDRALIEVRDFGPGVPEELLGAIFEPFVRAESDRSRSSGGVGLGLAIARRGVELHQGQITARNARPGLAVTMDLPQSSPTAPVPAPARLS